MKCCNLSVRMLPGKELEFEGGTHEDVIDKENEMEDFSCTGESLSLSFVFSCLFFPKQIFSLVSFTYCTSLRSYFSLEI